LTVLTKKHTSIPDHVHLPVYRPMRIPLMHPSIEHATKKNYAPAQSTLSPRTKTPLSVLTSYSRAFTKQNPTKTSPVNGIEIIWVLWKRKARNRKFSLRKKGVGFGGWWKSLRQSHQKRPHRGGQEKALKGYKSKKL
jgi:hypothetical protein